MFRRRLGFLATLALGFAAGSLSVTLTPPAGAKDDPEPASAVAAKAFFSPGGEIEAALIEAIKGAKQEIVVAMFNFTSRPLAEALCRAKSRGVDVRVVLDKSQAFMKYGKYNDLRRGKVDVRLMSLGRTSEEQQIRFHHKFMVIDRAVVTTGSFNWTSQADEQNWENEVVLGSKRLAAEFREQFEKAWAKAADEGTRKTEATPAPGTGTGTGTERTGPKD